MKKLPKYDWDKIINMAIKKIHKQIEKSEVIIQVEESK